MSKTTALLPNGKQVTTGTILVFINVGYQGNDLSVTLNNGQLQEDETHLVDAHGNVLAFTQEGDIVVKHLVVKDLELAQNGKFTVGKGADIELPSGEGQMVGYATIPANSTSLIA